MAKINFKLPGIIADYFTDRSMPRFELHADPPPGCIISTGAPDPEIPVMLRDVGVEQIIKMVKLTVEPYDCRVDIVIGENLLGILNYSQLYQLQCNMLWLLRDYIGTALDYGLEQRIMSQIEQLILHMISAEIRPGDFGYGIIEASGVGADDFGLDHWE